MKDSRSTNKTRCLSSLIPMVRLLRLRNRQKICWRKPAYRMVSIWSSMFHKIHSPSLWWMFDIPRTTCKISHSGQDGSGSMKYCLIYSSRKSKISTTSNNSNIYRLRMVSCSFTTMMLLLITITRIILLCVLAPKAQDKCFAWSVVFGNMTMQRV